MPDPVAGSNEGCRAEEATRLKSSQEVPGGVGTCACISGVQTPGASSQNKLFLLREALMLWCVGGNVRKQT